MIRTTVRVLLILSNAGGAVIGGTMVLTGTIVLVLLSMYLAWFSLSYLEDIMESMMILGAVVLAVTTLGSLGTFYEGKYGKAILYLYIISVVIIFGIQIYVTLVLYQYRGSKSEPFLKVNADFYKTNTTINYLPLFPAHLAQSKEFGLKINQLNLESGKKEVTSERRKRGLFSDDTATKKSESVHNKNMFSSFVGSTSNFLDGSRKNVGNVFSRGRAKIKNVTGDVISKSNSKLSDATGKVKEKAGEAVQSITDTVRKTGEGIMNVTNEFSSKSIYGWFLSKILESDDNKYVKKLQPILGPLSKPVLFVSQNATVMLLVYIIDFWEILCLTMAIYLCVTSKSEEGNADKNNKDDEDDDDDDDEDEEYKIR